MAQSFNDFRLASDDIPILMEMLAPYSYKWRDVLISCGVHHEALHRIETSFRRSLDCFVQGLEYWINEENEKATFSVLIEALRSPIVGLAALANKVIENRFKLSSSRDLIGGDEEQKGNSQHLSKSKGHLDRALKAGIVLVEIVTCIILGCAGAGKTCLKHILFGSKPPAIRSSTNVKDKVSRVDLHKFRYGNNRWQEIDSTELKELIATIIAAMETASAEDQQNKQRSTGNNDMTDDPSSILSGTTKTELFHYIADAVDKIKTEIFERMTRKTGDGQPVSMSSKWLYLTDSGGQPRFIDILPFFIHTLSGAVYVFRQCESLEKTVVSKYYRENICIGEQDSYATPLQNLKYLLQMVKTRPSYKEKLPTVLMVGTRKKGCPECDNEDAEPEDQNQKIKSMMIDCKVEKMKESGENIVHEINISEHKDSDSVEELQYSIEGLPPSESIEFPIWWYVYELVLDELTTTLNKKVLSFDECEQIAMHLGLVKGEAKECLDFLHKNNVIYYDPNVLEDAVIVDPEIPAKIVSLLVEICYLLQNKEKTKKVKISRNIEKLYGVKLNISSSIWDEMKTKGTVTAEIFQKFKGLYCFSQFSFEQLCKLFTKLYLMVSLPSTGEYFMPCLLEHFSPDELEEHRESIPPSIAEPLLLHFERGLPHPGIFFWLVAYLMNNGWTLPRDKNCNLVMLKRNCITLEAANISTPSLVTLINSLSYFEIHVHDGKSVKIFSEILALIGSGIGKASEDLKYGTIKLVLAFFCHNAQHNPEKNYHVGVVHQNCKLVCRHGGKPYNTDLEQKHTLWWKDDETDAQGRVDIDSAENPTVSHSDTVGNHEDQAQIGSVGDVYASEVSVHNGGVGVLGKLIVQPGGVVYFGASATSETSQAPHSVIDSAAQPLSENLRAPHNATDLASLPLSAIRHLATDVKRLLGGQPIQVLANCSPQNLSTLISTDWKLIKKNSPEYFETESTRKCMKMDEVDGRVSQTGKGASLAIIDFGYYQGSVALDAKSRITFDSDTASIRTHNETFGLTHGTVVASIAAGRPILNCVDRSQGSLDLYPGGVARGATLKCFSLSTKTPESIVPKKLETIAAAKNGELPLFDVVSLSLVIKRNDHLDSAFQKLLDQDTIVLAGCGNKGDSEEIGYPSCLEGVVSVGSLKYGGKISDFTRETPTHADVFVYGEVLAPYGEDQGDQNQGASLCCHQGTSMAAPAAAGLACLAIEYINTYCKNHHPTMNPLLLRRKRRKVIMDVFQHCGRDGEEKYRIHSAKKDFMSYIEDKTAHEFQ